MEHLLADNGALHQQALEIFGEIFQGAIPRANAADRSLRSMPSLLFEVVQESDGGYCAECLAENTFTKGDTCEELRQNAIEATAAFFFDRPRPERIRLHLVRDEILSVA
jgi:predicted RNase H-like HicB family nuclease